MSSTPRLALTKMPAKHFRMTMFKKAIVSHSTVAEALRQHAIFAPNFTLFLTSELVCV